MFTAADFAKQLKTYFEARMVKVSTGQSLETVCLLNTLFVTFALSLNEQKPVIEVSMENRDMQLGEGYEAWMSKASIDLFYANEAQAAASERKSCSKLLLGTKISREGDSFRFFATLYTSELGPAFRAVYNEYIRPTLHYVRMKQNRT